MALDFQASIGKFGDEIDANGISCSLSQALHTELFSEANTSEHPILESFRDFYSDAYVETKDLKDLIGEIEEITLRFPHSSAVKSFLGPFHSLCVIALMQDGGISAYCD